MYHIFLKNSFDTQIYNSIYFSLNKEFLPNFPRSREMSLGLASLIEEAILVNCQPISKQNKYNI